MKQRVTLRDIAEKAGVTRMAASLALRGKKGVSEATRDAVMKVAEQLGYQPDPELSKMLSHIRRNSPAEMKSCLALITSGRTAHDWKRYVTERKYVEGARARAREYGYRLEEFWLNEPGMTEERLSEIIWNRGIEGVVIAPLQVKLTGNHDERLIRLDYNLFSVVEISETVEWPDLDRSISDQYTAMIKALEELTKLNYRCIGLVLEEALDLRVNGKWTAAYLQTQIRGGPAKLPPPLILPTVDQKAFDKWFDRYKPDVIVSVDRFGLQFLRKRGLSIPGDVGYATLDLDGDADEVPELSGIDQNSRMVGAAAIDLLVVAIHRSQRGIPEQPLRLEIEGAWKPGKSTQRLPASPA